MAIELTEDEKSLVQKMNEINTLRLRIRNREKVMYDRITNLESSQASDKWEQIQEERVKCSNDTNADRANLESLEAVVVL